MRKLAQLITQSAKVVVVSYEYFKKDIDGECEGDCGCGGQCGR